MRTFFANNVNEQCWVLLGRWQGKLVVAEKVSPSQGSPSSVAFDFDFVLDRENLHGDVVGFLHTHPSGKLDPSSIDIATMNAWTDCLGKTLYCLIAEESNIEAFEFEFGSSAFTNVSCEIVSRDQVVILKEEQ